ncbi:tetratricopeptide repeat-containing diguanylate cyclase [Undibacterium sp.]|jgi:diguanylate cyclase (GGDEF)-like protein|uniref:tetratricopeptide repeat-containing diguanylate cyclase n=1 Tax=Undibacterium sp. TaxID=1914977 RepID=UPI002B869443|nr:diguanylate cyclase [Undibacterium sp.]HTD06545.1 diguanylate cyclase [Undibacterium sp.]
MYLYALDEEVERLNAELVTLSGSARLDLLVAIAWHQRQRDSRAAAQMLDEAETLLRNSPLMPDQRRAVRARIALSRAEIAALFGEFDKAEALLMEARAGFNAVNDIGGEGDALLGEVVIALEQGQMERAMRTAKAAVSYFERSGESLSQFLAEAWHLYLVSFSDPSAAAGKLLELQANAVEPRHPALEALITAARGETLFSPELTRSAILFYHSSELAREAGLVRLSIMASANAGAALQKLGDFDEAAACYDWAVSRARKTGWPALIGFSLMRLGELLRHLGQLEQSHVVLLEALQGFAVTKSGISKAVAHGELAHTLLERGMPAESATMFDIAITLYREAGSRSSLAEHLICQARALSAAGKSDEALSAVDEADRLLKELDCAALGVDLREALAEIHGQHSLPLPDKMTAPNPVLHYLEDALRAGSEIEGWLAPSKLLLALGEAWSSAGEGKKAFDYAKLAIAADQRERNKQASNWATLMQVRHETERAKAAAEHHQQLAATLTETSHTLDLLSKIGQELTANLNPENVCNALHRHLGTLLDASHLSIWLLGPDGKALDLCHHVENGVVVPDYNAASYKDAYNAKRCITEWQEILLEMDAANTAPDHMPDFADSIQIRTALFGPLIVGERVLGAMSIKSGNQDAYGERQRLIFRTLCAYGAIALDNANAHRDLQEIKKRLEQALRELEDASLTDPLTGLRNRRFLAQNIEADVTISNRSYQDSMAVGASLPKDADLLMFVVDLDHFKLVNDKYGHAAGDAILVQIRQRLQQVFRDSDYLIRWGGEEFLVVARGISRERADELAARVCAVVADHAFTLDENTQLHQTCSVGFACYPFVTSQPRAVNWQDVIDIADIALYTVKHAGRNGWVGLFGEAHAWPDLLLCTLKADPKKVILSRELRLSSNKSAEEIANALDLMTAAAG